MIDIVIVNWNSGCQLENCVDSLANTFGGKIIVVDNASTDGSEMKLDSHVGIKLIKLTQNQGFGSACNLGATCSESKYLLFLNPDAAIYPGTLEKVLDFFKDSENSNIGICGVQLVDAVGHVSRSCCRFPSPFGLALHAVGLDRLFPRLGHFMSEWSHDTTREVDHVIGAFYFVRREVFDDLSGFDERFFVYLEDLDFSLRAKKAGWHSAYLATVKAFHAGGGTSNQIKAKRLFYSLRSRLLYAHKHFSFFGFVCVFLASLFVEPFARTAQALSRHSWSGFKETWSGFGMLYRWLPNWVLRGVTR
jgi:GT2 family glycosyltransferase